MNIHVVQPGDTIYTIADQYSVNAERLALDNDISDPNHLIPGEALFIIRPIQTYIVQEGDSLANIADENGIDIMELLRNNPNLSYNNIPAGIELVISYGAEKTGAIRTGGFAYYYIDPETLRKTLPYLTYLYIYSYQIMPSGDLSDIDDLALIRMAKAYDVAPIMSITALNEVNGVETNIMHTLLTDIQIQDNFIYNIQSILYNKGYYGINIDTPFIQPQDQQAYVNFIDKITKRFNSEGFIVMVTLSPSVFEASTGIIYSGIDYVGLSRAANMILYQLTYAWRYRDNLPLNILPVNAVMQTATKAIQLITPEKFMLGISNIGYLWEFPYFAALTNVSYLSYNTAIQLAGDTGSVIQFNDPSYSSYFQYIPDGHEYMAWFIDIRAVELWSLYLRESGLNSLSLWNIMVFVTNIWLLINAKFEIVKLFNHQSDAIIENDR